MKLTQVLTVTALLMLPTASYSQFNTIKKIKTLPQIQIDTANEGEKVESSLPIDSLRFMAADKRPGAVVSMPLFRPIINSTYGNRMDPLTGKESFHQGIDFKGAADSVMVVMPGEVKKVAYSRGLGNYIEVEHGDFKTTYGHLSFVMVREKTKVNAGTVIGITGSTGRSTGDHLHFAIKHKGRSINPLPFLDIIYREVQTSTRKKDLSQIRNY